MNLYFRLLMAFVRGWVLSTISPTDILTRHLRVLPNDIDINGHLNNARYTALVDLLIIEHGVRAGVLGKAFAKGWRPMNAGAMITYRKQIKPFEKITVTYGMDCWDDKWVFNKFEFRKSDGTLAAVGYLKSGLVSRRGLVLQKTIDEAFKIDRGTCVLPPAVTQWCDAESALMAGMTAPAPAAS